jgi:hypothetical protein
MKNLAVANGTYEKDGQQKTRWVNVGKILEKDGKEFMLIDPLVNFAAFPREQGKDMVMVGIFEENNNQQGQQQGYNQQQQQQNYNQPQQQGQNQYNQQQQQNYGQ